MDRIIALVDMDCFYVQVEQRANPDLRGKPCAVVQYKTWKGGGIIAVGYEARACGVTRQMRGDDARKKCPEIKLVQVPEVRGKAELTKYREAGAEVIQVFMTFTEFVERASVDEAYIDLTSLVDERLKSLGTGQIQLDQVANTYAIGYGPSDDRSDKEKSADPTYRKEAMASWLSHLYDAENLDEEATVHERRIAMGAVIVEEMRAAVYEQTGFRCSAGIAHNKMLAKLAAGVHKPNGQSTLPHASVHGLYTRMPIKKVRHFGGKFGDSLIDQLEVEYMADLCQFSEKYLQEQFGEKSGSWVHEVCRGFEHEPVSARQLPKSIGCSKNFRGRERLDTKEKVKFWLKQLSTEVEERLIKDKDANKRVAKHLSVHLSSSESRGSRSCGILRYDGEKFASDAFLLLSKFNSSAAQGPSWTPPVTNLSVCAGKFAPLDEGATSIKDFLAPGASQASQPSQLPPASQSSRVTASQTKDTDKPRKGSIHGFFQNVAMSNERLKCAGTDDNGENQVTATCTDLADTNISAKVSVEKNGSQKKSFFERYMKNKLNIETPKDAGISERELMPEDTQSETTLVKNSVESSEVNVHVLSELDEGQITPNGFSDVETDEDCIPAAESSCTNVIGNFNEDSSPHPQPSCSDADDYILCDKCNKQILVWDLPEHNDFHFALELQGEQGSTVPQLPLGGTIGSMTPNASQKSLKRKSTGDSRGRGRPPKRTSLESGSKPSQKLDRFFRKS